MEIRGGEVENGSDGALVVPERCAVGDGRALPGPSEPRCDPAQL